MRKKDVCTVAKITHFAIYFRKQLSDYCSYISDFGLSKFVDPKNAISQSMKGCGTEAYQAPEVIQSYHYGPKADVYSFGILMYEVVTGQLAFHNYTKAGATDYLTKFSTGNATMR